MLQCIVSKPNLLYFVSKSVLSDNFRLDKLEEKIDAVMKILPKHEEPNLSAIGRGTMCLAKFTTDDK